MPIWLHLASAFVTRLFGFLTACLAASSAMVAVSGLLELDLHTATNIVRLPLVVLSAAIMFTSVYWGIRGGNWLVLQLPARCPQCGGRAWGQGCKVVIYTCENCGQQESHQTE